MVKVWEVPVQENGNSERTNEHVHMSGNPWREGIDHEEGIEKRTHIDWYVA